MIILKYTCIMIGMHYTHIIVVYFMHNHMRRYIYSDIKYLKTYYYYYNNQNMIIMKYTCIMICMLYTHYLCVFYA